MGDQAKCVHEGVTVVTGKDETGITFIFIIKKEKVIVYSFPTTMHVFDANGVPTVVATGNTMEIEPKNVEKFLSISPPSETLDAIRRAWEKTKVSEVAS